MKIIDVNELKRIEIDLLNELDKYCKQFNLQYYIAYGTLIGAVRHKGFIPWDDDIDVFMPRYYYERFITDFNANSTTKHIKVISRVTEKTHSYPFAKLINTNTVLKEKTDGLDSIGVYIDIFPLDNLSDNYKEAKARMRKAFWYDEKWMIKTIAIDSSRNIIKNMILALGKLVIKSSGTYEILTQLDDFCKERVNSSYTNYVGVMCGISAGDETRVFKKEWFDNTVLLEFEGRKYPAPCGYDSLLKQLYGNYLELPSKENRVSHHVFEAWYKD